MLVLNVPPESSVYAQEGPRTLEIYHHGDGRFSYFGAMELRGVVEARYLGRRSDGTGPRYRVGFTGPRSVRFWRHRVWKQVKRNITREGADHP